MSGQDKEKIAPVQGYTPGIPWSLHLEAYDVYSRRWAPQPALIDLEGRGCRGGFSTSELDEFIPGWRDRVSELVRVKTQRDELLKALKNFVNHGTCFDEDDMAQALAAIAKVEGGAA